jgi:hypothetical protein
VEEKGHGGETIDLKWWLAARVFLWIACKCYYGERIWVA